MDAATHPPLNSRNEDYGFYGTMACTGQDAAAAWAIAAPLIAAETGCSPEGVRAFLDSRHGRHFADEVANQLVGCRSVEPAIRAAIDTHQVWQISPRTTREHGIPTGLPYLTGWVAHFEILGEVR